jgi:orotidine-5'-phosphate decarboxylase
MTRKTLDAEARPRTSPEEAEQIETAARHRRIQMLPGEGPHAPERDEPTDHFRGKDDIILGGGPIVASYTDPRSDAEGVDPDDADDDSED